MVKWFFRVMENVLYRTKKGSSIVTGLTLKNLFWCQIYNFQKRSIQTHMQHIFHKSEQPFHHAKPHLSMKWFYIEPFTLLKNHLRTIFLSVAQCSIFIYCHATIVTHFAFARSVENSDVGNGGNNKSHFNNNKTKIKLYTKN